MFQKLGAPRLLAATTILLSISGTAQAQFTTSDFTAYKPANAASIQPGNSSLYSIPVNSLVPTQINVGDAEVFNKAAAFNLLDVGGVNSAASQAALQSDLLGTVEPVVIGPDGQLYQTDGHHSFSALTQSVFGASNPTVYVQVVANYSGLTTPQFIQTLEQNTQIYPFNNGVQQTVAPNGSNLLSPLPTSLSGLVQDPYRGLEYSGLKNKGAAGVSHDKTLGNSDFMWSDLYRTAPGVNGGSGLPYLTPADANKAAIWSQTGTNTGTLPGYGTVAVNQMPGYILPGSIVASGPLTNANLGTGAIDGSVTGTVTTPSMTGINGYTTNGVVVEPQVTGLVIQLGANSGGTVTLSNTNSTYTGGTTFTAGTLIITAPNNGSDGVQGTSGGSLGAGTTGALGVSNGMVTACAGANNYSSCVDNAVRATNGIVFESLTEGNATLQFGTTAGTNAFTEARNISIGQEIANFNMNGNTVTLIGNIATSNINTSGAAPLVVNDSTGTGTLVLTGNNTAFNGDIEIEAGTLRASNDAALGATSGPAAGIGQINLAGGTFQAGATFSSVRTVEVTSSSNFDTAGFSTTFAGNLNQAEHTLTVLNSGTTAGSVTFNAYNVGETAQLALAPGSTGPATTTVTFTNGINRVGNGTLMIDPASGSTLGGAVQVYSSGASAAVVNGMVAPWMIGNSGGSASTNAYNFLTYGASGYANATAASNTVVGSTASQLVSQTSSASLTTSASAYALQVQAGAVITVGGNTLTLGTPLGSAAGLIMQGSGSEITGGTLAFGTNEALIYANGTGHIISTITGSGGITLTGAGKIDLGVASANTGAVFVNSGTLDLQVANALANSNVTLDDVKANPSNSILQIDASNTFTSLNSLGSHSAVDITAGKLTINNGSGQVSTLSSSITETGTLQTGAITKAGGGLLDLSGGASKGITLVSGSSIVVSGGQLRLSTNQMAAATTFSLSGGTELQFVQGGSGAFASAITGGGLVHIESGTLQLTGIGNTYTGGTIMEIGTSLVATTANLSSATGQSIVNAGGTLVLDQIASGNFTAIMSDGVPGTDGQTTGAGSFSGSLVKADSTGANSGNVTITNAQLYTGATTVEAGTLTLGAVNSVAKSSGVALGTVGGVTTTGGVPTATLALGADNTVQGLNSVAGNTTAVTLGGHALTVQQTAGAVSSFSGNISDTGTGGLNTTNGGTLALSGTNQIGGTMTIGAGTTISQTGGSLSVGAGATSGTTTVTNNGTLVLSGTSATYGGTFVNNSTILSDPSTQTFNNLSVSTLGTIQASAGDVYKVGGNFANLSTQSGTWNTSQAELQFFGGTNHDMDLVTTDAGNLLPINRASFNWGTLSLFSTSDSLTLCDAGNCAPGQSGLAFYVDDVVGALISGNDVTNIIGDGFNIYYDPYDAANLYLDGMTYQLADGGELIADVPEPSSILLLMSGLGGGALLRRRRRGPDKKPA